MTNSDTPGMDQFEQYLAIVQFRISTEREVVYQIIERIVTMLATEKLFNSLGYSKQEVVQAVVWYYNCWSCGCLDSADKKDFKAVLDVLATASESPEPLLHELASQHIDKAHDFLIASKPMRGEQIIHLKHLPCLEEVGLYRQLKQQCPNIIFFNKHESTPDCKNMLGDRKLPSDFVSVVHRRIKKWCQPTEIAEAIVRFSAVLQQMGKRKEINKFLCLFGVANVSPDIPLHNIRTPSNLMLLLTGLKQEINVYPNKHKLLFLEEEVRYKITAGFQNHARPWESLERLVFFFNGLWQQAELPPPSSLVEPNDTKLLLPYKKREEIRRLFTKKRKNRGRTSKKKKAHTNKMQTTLSFVTKNKTVEV